MPVPYDKKVVQGTLTELWNDSGPVPASKGRDRLTADDFKELLRQGPLQFVEVIPGGKLKWLDSHDCYRFWKDKVQSHLCVTETWYLSDFPDEWCYTAEWVTDSRDTVVVLQMHH